MPSCNRPCIQTPSSGRAIFSCRPRPSVLCRRASLRKRSGLYGGEAPVYAACTVTQHFVCSPPRNSKQTETSCSVKKVARSSESQPWIAHLTRVRQFHFLHRTTACVHVDSSRMKEARTGRWDDVYENNNLSLKGHRFVVVGRWLT